jgi:hypothetical protein
MTTKYTKLPKNKANDHKVCQMVSKDIKYPFKGLPKCTKNWRFGLKINPPILVNFGRPWN